MAEHLKRIPSDIDLSLLIRLSDEMEFFSSRLIDGETLAELTPAELACAEECRRILRICAERERNEKERAGPAGETFASCK